MVREPGAVQALVDLLSDAQPDGQYSAAAALVNLSACQPAVLPLLLQLDALPAVIALLSTKSW